MPKATNAVKSTAGKSAKSSAKTAPQRAPQTTAKRAKAVVETALAAAAAVAKQRNKLVRDSFTIPKSEYSVLEGLKLRAAMLKRPTKKSELLRAGISVLNALSDKQFLIAIGAVPSLKTGRPKAEIAEATPVK